MSELNRVQKDGQNNLFRMEYVCDGSTVLLTILKDQACTEI